VLARLDVQHELADRPLQPRQWSAQDDEAGNGDLSGGREVHGGRSPPMPAPSTSGAGLEGEGARLAPAPLLAIGRLVRPVRHVVRQHVRQLREARVERLARHLELGLADLQKVLELRHLVEQLGQRLAVRPAPLADLLREPVPERLVLLHPRLDERHSCRGGRARPQPAAAAPLQLEIEGVGVLPQHFRSCMGVLLSIDLTTAL
jgi:hypothetical protein